MGFQFRLSVIALLAALSTGRSAAQPRPGPEVIDKVVAIVGRQAITSSEVDRQLRLQALLGGQPYDPSPQQRSDALERLIRQALVEQEMAIANFPSVKEKTIEGQLEAYRKERYWKGMSFEAALEHYGVSENGVRTFLRRLHDFLRFVDFRFRTGLEASREEVERYYEETFIPDLRAAGNPAPPPLEDVYEQLEERVIDQKVESRLDLWLKEVRSTTRVTSPDPIPRRGRTPGPSDLLPVEPERK